MKKIYKYIIICLFILFPIVSFLSPVYANDVKVIDEPHILDETQKESLTKKIHNINQLYNFDLAIVIVNSTDGQNITAFADDYYDNNDYGMGINDDGALLVLDYKNREVAISTHSYGLTAFTDYGIDYILDDLVDYFKSNDYYGGFQSFVKLSNQFIKEAKAGQAFDTNHEIPKEKNYALSLVIGIASGTILAFIVTQNMKSKLKSVHPATSAASYVTGNGLNLATSQDVFLYTSTTRTKIVKSSSSSSHSSGGGSSSHRSSSGRTHGGGSRRF